MVAVPGGVADDRTRCRHRLIGHPTLLAGAHFWLNRARNTAKAATELADLGRDAIGSIRQWTFERKTGVHPVDESEDPRLAAGARVVALVELGATPSEEQNRALVRAAQSSLGMSHAEAQELLVLGPWCVRQSPSVDAALARIARRMRTIGATEMLDPAPETLRAQVAAGPGRLTDRQREALADIARQVGRHS